MHLDPRLLGVPDRAMGKAVRVEIRTDLAVHPVQQVEVEGRRHPRRIVIGAHQRVFVLDEIDPHDEAPDARPVAHAAHQRPCPFGVEVAQGRAGEEAHARVSLIRQPQGLCEIGHDGMDRQVGIIAGQSARGLLEEARRDVDRHIGRETGQTVEQQPRLDARAAAEFDQLRPLGHMGGQTVRARGQDRGLGAGRVIFRQLRDALEERAALGIVEPFRLHTLRALRQAAQRIGQKLGVADDKRVHHTSLASRRPIICHLWCG